MSTTVNVLETKIGGTFTGESAGTLDLSKLPDYGAGSSVVLAPDGKGVISNGKYTSLEPGATNMSGSERNELRSNAAANTKLLLAQQELEENGTPIAETLGLKQPGDKGYDGEDREKIQQAENAASVILREQSDIAQYKYEQKRNESGPSAIELHNQIFGGKGNAPGTVKQDENGNWYAVKIAGGTENSENPSFSRDYTIDPKNNSQGPTFGGHVSEFIENTFPKEVANAGGSSTYTGSILDTFTDTDERSLMFPESDSATGSNNLYQNLANLFTPFNDTEYVGGELINVVDNPVDVEVPVDIPVDVEVPVDIPVDSLLPVDPGLPDPNLPFAGGNFYGGYQPVSASDVLVPNVNATDPYLQPLASRLNPMFPQGNFQSGYVPLPTERVGIRSLFDEPATDAMYQGIMS